MTTPIRMSLLENAYDFLNESLRSTVRAVERPDAWKFAVIHVAHAIELLLKAQLHAVHPVLIYQDIDRRKQTVSMAQAVERITAIARIDLTEKEQRSIRKARLWRDTIVHYEFEMSPFEVEAIYVQLFEFLVRFHDDHTSFGALHDHIAPELWPREAELFEFFEREFIMYNGVQVGRWLPAQILQEQARKTIELHGREYERVRYGTEPGLAAIFPDTLRPCPDCAATSGQLHLSGCDWEICPRCFDQQLGCGCLFDDGPPDADLRTPEIARQQARRQPTRAGDDGAVGEPTSTAIQDDDASNRSDSAGHSG